MFLYSDFCIKSKVNYMSILTIILNIIFPPLGVALAKGAGKDLVINIILTLLGFLPGVIHAFYVTSK